MKRNYPKYNAKTIPKKDLLVLSCMDLRLTDDLVSFLNHENLTNRYDHVISAGAALCHCAGHKNYKKHFKKKLDTASKPELQLSLSDLTDWSKAFDSHLKAAIELHHIKDVYIIEHEGCGAYNVFLTKEAFEKEEKMHKEFSDFLAAKINKAFPELHVHCFLMNLRGDVKRLN